MNWDKIDTYLRKKVREFLEKLMDRTENISEGYIVAAVCAFVSFLCILGVFAGAWWHIATAIVSVALAWGFYSDARNS